MAAIIPVNIEVLVAIIAGAVAGIGGSVKARGWVNGRRSHMDDSSNGDCLTRREHALTCSAAVAGVTLGLTQTIGDSITALKNHVDMRMDEINRTIREIGGK